jgi:two-component system chemotaxis response regulator CheY
LKRNILIIDDSRPILTLLHVILNKKFQVFATSNAIDAMKWLNAGNTPDLIISDIQMPEIDGWAFIENLRSSLVYDNIPIIVLSGADRQELEVECSCHNITDYILKPFDPSLLLEKIDAIMLRRYVTE